jgi:hypothetical protein
MHRYLIQSHALAVSHYLCNDSISVFILNSHKITYGLRYLDMQRVTWLRTLITSRNG